MKPTTRQPARPVAPNERLDRNVVDDNIRRIPDRIVPGNVLVEQQKTNNSYELANGAYGGGQFTTPKGTVFGQGATCFSKEHFVSSTGQYRVSGIIFENTVVIDGVVLYNNCRFEKAITVNNGAKVVFIGCVFVDEAQITNLGAVLDCAVVGTIRIGVPAHVNVTLVAEVVV